MRIQIKERSRFFDKKRPKYACSFGGCDVESSTANKEQSLFAAFCEQKAAFLTMSRDGAAQP
jgi:hypothetical protein